MKVIRRLATLFILGGLLAAPYTGNADLAPLGAVGIGRSPMGGSAASAALHQTTRMDSEEVTIRLHKGRYTVHAVFQFFNTGETETLWVGFPRLAAQGRSLPVASDFLRFDAWVNGKKVPFTEVQALSKNTEPLKNRSGLSWVAQHIAFEGNGRTTIRVSYEANYGIIPGTPPKGVRAYYIYGTGAYWKDSIGRAVFTIDATETGGAKRWGVAGLPRRARRVVTRNLIRYEVRDLEPNPDACMYVGNQNRGEL